MKRVCSLPLVLLIALTIVLALPMDASAKTRYYNTTMLSYTAPWRRTFVKHIVVSKNKVTIYGAMQRGSFKKKMRNTKSIYKKYVFKTNKRTKYSEYNGYLDRYFNMPRGAFVRRIRHMNGLQLVITVKNGKASRFAFHS